MAGRVDDPVSSRDRAAWDWFDTMRDWWDHHADASAGEVDPLPPPASSPAAAASNPGASRPDGPSGASRPPGGSSPGSREI